MWFYCLPTFWLRQDCNDLSFRLKYWLTIRAWCPTQLLTRLLNYLAPSSGCKEGVWSGNMIKYTIEGVLLSVLIWFLLVYQGKVYTGGWFVQNSSLRLTNHPLCLKCLHQSLTNTWNPTTLADTRSGSFLKSPKVYLTCQTTWRHKYKY